MRASGLWILIIVGGLSYAASGNVREFVDRQFTKLLSNLAEEPKFKVWVGFDPSLGRTLHAQSLDERPLVIKNVLVNNDQECIKLGTVGSLGVQPGATLKMGQQMTFLA
jgi:hypothetical protein